MTMTRELHLAQTRRWWLFARMQKPGMQFGERVSSFRIPIKLRIQFESATAGVLVVSFALTIRCQDCFGRGPVR